MLRSLRTHVFSVVGISLALLLLPAGLIGCGILPAIPAYTSKNEPREPRPEGRDTRPRVRVERAEMEPSHGPVDKPFVGIAISGGGSRAAAFGAAVLQELDRLGFLQHVTAISSVSGGGLPAAYYALHGDSIRTDSDWEHVHDLMRTNFRTKWLWRYLRPDNLLLTATTDYDRSNVLADVLNDVLFKDATFSSLGSAGPRRPTLLINATQLGLSEARQFTFTGSNFISYVDSDLNKYSIADAVVASAAFPGVFSAVTLKNYVTGPRRATPLPQGYVHLIDGGPSDNLGVDTLLSAARAHRGTSKQSNFRCFIFAVDAYPPGADPSMTFRRDLRDSAIDYIVDTNFLDAFDALLARRRESTLRDLGFRLEVRGAADHPLSDLAWPRRTGNVRETFYAGEEALSRLVQPYDRVVAVPLGRSPEAAALENASCQVWHVAMSEVASVKYDANDIPAQAGPIGEARHPVLVFRQRVWHVTSRIQTDFNLGGPTGCEPSVLQSILRDTAHILIHEDDPSREAACKWFTSAFPGERFSCESRSAPLRHRDLPLQVLGRRPSVEISCTP